MMVANWLRTLSRYILSLATAAAGQQEGDILYYTEATAVPDRATHGPRTSVLSAVRGQLKSPNPWSADVPATRGPRTSALNLVVLA